MSYKFGYLVFCVYPAHSPQQPGWIYSAYLRDSPFISPPRARFQLLRYPLDARSGVIGPVVIRSRINTSVPNHIHHRESAGTGSAGVLKVARSTGGAAYNPLTLKVRPSLFSHPHISSVLVVLNRHRSKVQHGSYVHYKYTVQSRHRSGTWLVRDPV